MSTIITINAPITLPPPLAISAPITIGYAGKSRYQSYLDTTADDPPMSEAEWSTASGGTMTAEQIAAAYDAETDLATTPEIQTGTETATRRINPAVLNAAITAIAQGIVNAVINAAPGALDTLDELAAALGDDANFAATVTTALAGKYGAGSSPNFANVPFGNGSVGPSNYNGFPALKSGSYDVACWTYTRGIWIGVNEIFGASSAIEPSTGYADVGLSRSGPSTWAMGDGTPGNKTGTLELKYIKSNYVDGNISAYHDTIGMAIISPYGLRIYQPGWTLTASIDSATGNASFTGDIEATTIAKGVILKSPDGTRYRVTMANGGTLAIAAV